MEKRVIYSTIIKVYLKELVDILYSNNYFGFNKDAKLYVQEIILYINNYDFVFNVRETPESHQRFGKNFIKYKANNNTTWYIFFDQKGEKIFDKTHHEQPFIRFSKIVVNLNTIFNFKKNGKSTFRRKKRFDKMDFKS